MKRPSLPLAYGALLAFACLLLGGCRSEETRPSYRTDDVRVRAVLAAEQKRAEALAGQQPPPPAAPASATQPPSPAPPATPGDQTAGTPSPAAAPQYQPPSAQGAYVEMTETPAGTPPPPASLPAPSASTTPAAGGGTGGNVPHDLPGSAPTGATSPPSGASGRLGSTGTAPPVLGINAPPGLPMSATAAAELADKRAAFERLMQHAQQAAEAEKAAGRAAGSQQGVPERAGGRLAPGGYGAGGAAGLSTGLGASPDLSGRTQGNPRVGGPSAVQAENLADEDIVARQLREAAQTERDPVLREKLWLEYRKYTRP